MNPIQPPIKPSDTGEAVSNLRVALLFLLEQNAIKSQQPPNRPTADELLALGTQVRSEQVGGKSYDGEARQVVLYIQLQAGLGDGLGGVVEEKTADLLNQLLKEHGALDPGSDLVVRGTVRDANGHPESGLVVIAFDRDLRRWQELGRAETDAAGRYEIPYRYESFRQAEGIVQPELDLVLQVARRLATEDLEPIHVHEEPKPVPPIASIDVVLPAATERGPSEFERASALIPPLLIGQGAAVMDRLTSLLVGPNLNVGPLSFADLRPYEITRDDIAFIVRETGLDAKVVAAWADAARMARDLALSAAEPPVTPGPQGLTDDQLRIFGWNVFHGFVRNAQALDLDAVLAYSADTWAKWQGSNAEGGWVAAEHERRWFGIVQALERLRRLRALDPVVNPAHPLARVLAAVAIDLPAAMVVDAADIFAEHGIDDPEAFFKLAPGGFDGPGKEAVAVRRLVRGIRLHNLTGGHTPLMKTLAKVLDEQGADGHDLQPLAKAGTKQWTAWCGGADEPAASPAGTALPWVLQARVERVHPSLALAARLEDQALPLSQENTKALHTAIQTAPDAVAALLGGQTGEATTPVPEDARDLVHNLGRFLKLGFTLEVGSRLWSADIKTPGALANLGSDVAQGVLGEAVPVAYVERVMQQAQAIVATSGALFNAVAGSQAMPFGLHKANQPVSGTVAESLPTLRGLFGDLDECMCRPCESVLGLPAYLVDLLSYLRKIPANRPNANTALQVLRSRRPDIPAMPLGCEQAEQEVQHIDLVVEVLEHATGADPDSNLAAATFPWSLPFGRVEAEQRAWLDVAGVDRAAWMAQLRGRAGSASHVKGLAAERLGLSLAAWPKVATPAANDDDVWTAYGFTSANAVSLVDPASGQTVAGTPSQLLTRVSVLLNRSGLELEELVGALRTRFVAGSVGNRPDITGLAGCKTSEMRVTPLTPQHLDRLHRFVRLWRALPSMPIPVLDSALTACSQPPTADFGTVLVRLSRLVALRRRLAMGMEAVLALFQPLHEVRVPAPNFGSQSLYASVFRSGQLSTAQRNPFPEDPTVASAFAFGPLTPQIPAIVLAMRSSPQAIARWVHVGGASSSASAPAYLISDSWDYLTLTHLYRRQTLAGVLSLPPGDLALICAMTGAWPLQAASMEEFLSSMESLLDGLDIHARSGLSIEQVAQLLLPVGDRKGVPVPAQAMPDWAGIKSELHALRQTLRNVTQVLVAGEDDSLLQAKREALDSLAVWVKADALQSLATALSTGVATDLPSLASALDVPVAGVLEANARATVVMTPPETGALLALPSEQARLQALHDRIHQRRLQVTLRQELARWSQLSEPAVDRLLMRDLPVEVTGRAPQVAELALLSTAAGDFMDPNVSDAQAAATTTWVDWMHRLQRWAWLTNQLEVTDPLGLLEAARLAVVNGASGAWPFSLLTLLAPHGSGQGRVRWAEWRSLLGMVWMLREGKVSAALAADLLRDVGTAGNAPTAITWSPLASAWSVPPSDLFALLSALLPSTGEGLDPWHWWRAHELLRQSMALKSALPHFLTINEATLTAKTAEVAKAMAMSVRPSASAKVQDSLKLQWRDALLAHATTAQAKSVDALYAYYLIDMQMAPCMKTTRILQAIASVQQFVHRIFFGLEPRVGARPGADLTELRRQWAWMSQYRVWEANRKVFLFPENWLLPELRDDKSEGFKALEAALGQPEITQTDAGHAFARFLEDVTQIGRVHVLGMFEDIARGPQPSRNIERRDLYQIGRTPQPPYRYYWRVCQDFGLQTMEWAPWRLIDLDIQGDHVVPFVLNGDLHIVWPIFERESSTAAGNAVKLKMAWSRLVARRWSGIEITRDALLLTVPPMDDERTGFAFRCHLLANESARVIAYTKEATNRIREGVVKSAVSVNQLERLVLTDTMGLPSHPNTLMLGELQASGSVASRVGSVPPGAKEDVAAILRIIPSVWVRVKADLDGKPTEGYVLLDSSSGRFEVSLDITAGSTTRALDAARDPTIWAPVVTGIPYSIPALKVRARLGWRGSPGGLVGQSGDLDLESTVAGKFRNASLTLVIEPLTPPWLADLGITIDRPFVPAAEFQIRRAGSADLMSVRLNEPNLTVLQRCLPLINGYKGNDRSAPIRLPAAVNAGGDIEPFKLPYWLGEGFFSNAGNFWVVGAASNELPAGQSAVWHYFDGHDACLIDTSAAGGTSGRFDVHAASYTDAVAYRAEFAKSAQALVTQGNAPIYFSADGLPRPSPAGDTPAWQQQLRGDRGFDLGLPYGPYSWEVFFHAPLMIAHRLSQQGRYADAEQWLRMVLDPTSGEAGADARRFLRFRPFRDLDASKDVRESLEALAQAKRGPPFSDADAVIKLVQRWRRNAFMPFAIARGRPLAFMWRTVFAYLDNLLAWADDLFRMDTRESINEATHLFVLAHEMLGRRPKVIGGTRQRAPIAYDAAELVWDNFANAWIDLMPVSGATGAAQLNYTVGLEKHHGATSISGALYFCLPINPKILHYWDRVDERLFNIRHCRNIDGVQRDLPFTEAPIDPELLVRATAAGLDIGDVVRGLYAPPLAHRYQTLVSRALDLANEARSLAAGVLAAIEKRDGEHLSQLRSSNELALLERVRQVRVLQRNEAEVAIRGLEVNRNSAERRFRHLHRLMGTNTEPPAKFQTLGDEPVLTHPVAREGWGFSEGFGTKLALIEPELKHVDYMGTAQSWMIAAGVSKGVASLLNVGSALAEIKKDTSTASALRAVGAATSFAGDISELISKSEQNHASKEQLRAGHMRRRDEWGHQANQALAELRQIDRQFIAHEIRRDIASRELENQTTQIQESREIDDFLRAKFSNAELYQWMVGELSALLKSTYRLAVDMARRAESAAARELGIAPLNIVRYDHWNQRRGGLLAPELLLQDLKRLDLAHLERHRREHEMTKHVSLRLLDPVALVDLIKDRQCEFTLPEWLFDLDMPGHYMRRLKSVSVSVPCVVGPYASVNCKLTLLRSETRHDATRTQPYVKADDDERFTVQYLATESIVTSSGRDDSGLFETNLRDERYLPFENAGAIGHWRLEIPQGHLQFDLSTITDVVLHLRYTARDGGADMATDASDHLKTVGEHALGDKGSRSLAVLVSCATDFSGEWERAKATKATAFAIKVGGSFMPYWMRASGKNLRTSAYQVRLVRSLKQSVEVKDVEACQCNSPGDIQVSCPSGFSDHADVLVWADVS